MVPSIHRHSSAPTAPHSIASTMLPAQDELLMRAARKRLEPGDVERIRELCALPLDWSATIDSAHLHGVASLLKGTLADVASDLVPRAALDRLTAGFSSTAIFNLHLTRELLEILELLKSRNIPALPYKGSVLASLAYGNLALRQFADIDLLVRAEDLWEVDAIVRARGYTRKGGEADGVLPSEGQFMYEQTGGRAVVELHWELAQRFYSFPFDFLELWERRMTVEVGGRSVETFGFEDTIVALALHNTKHRWERLVWICDFAELVRRSPERDWDAVLEAARQAGAMRAVLLGFHLAGIVSGAVLPQMVRERISLEPKVALLAREVIEGIVRGGGEYSPIAQRVAFNLQARERLADRLRFGWRRLMVPTLTDRSAIRLPAAIDPLYYLVRPVRLLAEQIKSILQGRS